MSVILIDNPTQQAREASLKTKLEAVRTQLRLVSRDVQANEGRLLDFETSETVQRALDHSIKQLDQITLQVAVLERKVC